MIMISDFIKDIDITYFIQNDVEKFDGGGSTASVIRSRVNVNVCVFVIIHTFTANQ